MDAKKITYKCYRCGETFPDDEVRILNPGIEDAEHVACECCVAEMENNGSAIRCEGCGELFTPDMLKDETLCGETFTSCPRCGVDVVSGYSRAQYMEEYEPSTDCEVAACAYNNGGECRFQAVFDRPPVVTEEDGCTEGVIKDGIINV